MGISWGWRFTMPFSPVLVALLSAFSDWRGLSRWKQPQPFVLAIFFMAIELAQQLQTLLTPGHDGGHGFAYGGPAILKRYGVVEFAV